MSRALHTPTRLSDIHLITSYTEIPTGPGTTSPAQIVINGNDHMKSQELIAYELGYRFQPTKRVTDDTAVFYNTYDHLLSVENGSPEFGSTVVLPLDFGDNVAGYTYGGEIAATLQVTDIWRLTGSYSLLEANFHTTFGSTDATSVANLENSSPEHQAQLRSYLDITKNLQFNAAVFYVGPVGEFDVPGYVSTDLNILWRPKESLEIQIGVLNLFDNQHPEFGVTAGQGVESETPRTVYAQLNWKF